MSTFKHTPGPWGVHNNEVFAGPFKRIKGGISGFRAHICEIDDLDLDGIDEIEANARLIAAAPDLLEALHLLLDATYSDLVTIDDLGRAEAAIAKATQEPQK
jgi:hypothetical protein